MADLDVPEGSLPREAGRLLDTVAGFGGTLPELASLSARLRAHIANLARFGLDAQIADALLTERGTLEVINAVAIERRAAVIADDALVDVDEALGRVAQLVRSLSE